MIVDDVTITVEAGRGGDGAVSFRREKYVPKGGPDGGNGGRGANAYLLGVVNITALNPLKSKKLIRAQDGESGKSKKRHGANGKDLIVPVPVGTRVTDIQTGEQIEIDKPGLKIRAAKGGHGGRGNWEFRTAVNQTPRFAEKGRPGTKRTMHFNLRFIADAGLIGLPNAGKTSLLNTLTDSSSKVADYPFTTLEANLGDMHGVIIADIPGLIKGAHQGRGLGDKFLKHITKTKLLLHCIDISTENIMQKYQVIRDEITKFDARLKEKPEIILLTKSDLVEKSQLKNIIKSLDNLKKEVYEISILDDDKIKKLEKIIHKKLDK